MAIEFFLAMIPPTVTHQEKKISVRQGKPVVYEPEDLKAARQKLRAYLGRHRPEAAHGGGSAAAGEVVFSPGGRHRDGEYRITKPDTDNLQKLLKDCMTAEGFWQDDARAASEICEKFWAETPGIYIRVEALP